MRGLRRVRVLLVTAAITLLVSILAPSVAAAWTSPPREPLRPIFLSNEVPPMFRASREGYLGPYYVAPRSWAPLAETPIATTISPAERRRLARPWSAPLVRYADGALHENPVTTAQRGLGDYTRFLATKDRRFLAFFLRSADWLVSRQKADGSWRYDFAFADLQPGWSSAMAQGQGISVLTRAYLETGRRVYLTAARRAYAHMMKPLAEGGTLGLFPDGTLCPEEYPGSVQYPRVLNGSVFAIWGARDLWLATGDANASSDWRRLSLGLGRNLKAFDVGSWSSYCAFSPSKSGLQYHRLHVAQLRVTGYFAQDSRFSTISQRFYRYLLARYAW